MADKRIKINLTEYGLDNPIVVDVPDQAMGDDGNYYDSSYFPRNKQEIQLYSTYINEAAQSQYGEDFTGLPPQLINYMVQFAPTESINMAKKLQEAKKLSEQRAEDPLGFDMSVTSFQAKQKEFKFNDGWGTVMLPGGDPYSLDDFSQDMGKMWGSIVPEDPKTLTRSSAIVGLDSWLISQIEKNRATKARNPRGFQLLPKFWHFLDGLGKGKWGNTKVMAATGAVAGPAAYAADSAYEMMNSLYAYTQGIDAQSISERMKGSLRDAEFEMLIGMGAAGLGPIAKGIKKYAIDYPGGFRTDVSQKAIEKAQRQNIPLSRIAASESDWVRGYAKVIGVFPGAGAPIRTGQAMSRIAVNARIQDIMGTLAPGVTTLRGLQWAGQQAYDAFSKNVSKFRATNAVLYNSFFNQASKIDEAFIPTTNLKKWADSLNKTLSGGEISLGASAPDGTWVNNTSQLFGMLKVGDPTAGMKLLSSLGSMPDHITLKQFRQLQAQLNGAIRGFGGKGQGATGQVGIDPQGTLTYLKDNLEHGLNDYKNWKKMSGPNEVIAQSSIRSLKDANEFYMNNIELFGFGAGQRSIGKAAQQVNTNAFAPGAPFKPGSLQPDMVFNKIMTGDVTLSPMAIGELRQQLGKEPFGNMVATYLNKIVGQNTEIVETPWKRVRGVNPRMGVQTKVKGQPSTVSTASGTAHNSEFVPIINIDNLKKQLGMAPAGAGTVEDVTTRDAVVAMFDSLGQNGQKAYKDLQETLEIASLVDSFDIADVSDFVKRRGVLGGVKSLANAFVAGGVVSSPLATAGLILTANKFSKILTNPALLKNAGQIMSDRTKNALQRQQLVELIKATDSYYTIFDNEGAMGTVPGVELEGGQPFPTRNPGASAMNDDLRTINYFNNLVSKANAGGIGQGLDDLTDIELLDYTILATNGSPNMGTAKMTTPKYDRQGDLLGYESVDASGFGYDNTTPIMRSDGMIDVTPSAAAVYGMGPEVDELIDARMQAPNTNPYLVDVQRVLGGDNAMQKDFGSSRKPYEEDVTVGQRSNLNPQQQEALLGGDLDAAIMAGRN